MHCISDPFGTIQNLPENSKEGRPSPIAARPRPVHPMQSQLSPALGGIRLCRAPGCAKPLPQDRRERYCRKAACLQASKEARLAREAVSIKKAAEKLAAAEARLARLKKKLKPAKPVFVALLPMQNDRRAQAVDPTDWAAMEQAAAHWCRVKDEQNAKERCAAWCSILIATLTRSPAGLALEPRHLLGVGRLLRRARRRRLRLRR